MRRGNALLSWLAKLTFSFRSPLVVLQGSIQICDLDNHACAGREGASSLAWLACASTVCMSKCAQATRICKERGVQIDIEPAKTWWDAEEYHQKYIQKQRGAHYM
jgi:hypothetical protein